MNTEECRALYIQWLRDAMEAYHALSTGTSVRVIVDQNGERVEYTAANRQGLWAYISRLQNAIQSADPCSAFNGNSSKPVGFLF